MAYTVRETILRAINTALTTGAGYPTGLAQLPERGRLTPLEDAELPAIIWYPVSESCEDIGGRPGPVVRRRLRIKVEVHTGWPPNSTGYPSPDSIADPYLSWVTAVLTGENYSGLAHNTSEIETEWEFDESVKRRCRATVTLEIVYQAQTGNLEAS